MRRHPTSTTGVNALPLTGESHHREMARRMRAGKTIKENFYRLVASLPPLRPLFASPQPPPHPAPEPQEPLRLEIVCHCWQYTRLLKYQLSSLVRNPPSRSAVRMTVFYSPEDEATEAAVRYFQALEVPGVEWNPRPLPRERLFRRAIGRNLAALSTSADWIWFTDCDILFGPGSLDALTDAVRDAQDVLVFPRVHQVSPLLPPDHTIFREMEGVPGVLEIEDLEFEPEVRDRAVGGFQVLRGDVARAVGYCNSIPFYQEPVRQWQKSYEDRAFRWLLGTQGEPVEVPSFYRIRHAQKGRKGNVPGTEEGGGDGVEVVRGEGSGQAGTDGR